MPMLSAIGVPPDVSVYAAVMAQQVRYMVAMLWVLYLQRVRREMYLRLPAGEQYRRHQRAGGYIPV